MLKSILKMLNRAVQMLNPALIMLQGIEKGTLKRTL